jgi:spermidine synthase
MGAAARSRFPIVPGLLTYAIVIGGLLLWLSWNGQKDVKAMSRNFYGVLRVLEIFPDDPLHGFRLINGNINHGVQLVDPVMKNVPTSYYGEDSGIGVVMRDFPRQQNRRIGAIGLGIGTIAAYARAGDTISFYEINPQVEQIARKHFTYLEQCAGNVQVVMGDARLSLERESSHKFDVLVLDAFSSDAIPAHLLTAEAFTNYFRHLAPDGVIAIHVSNAHLDLFPVATGIAKHFHTLMLNILSQPPSMRFIFTDSNWILISRNEQFMNSPEVLTHATSMPEQESAESILWTDDYVSLLKILRR